MDRLMTALFAALAVSSSASAQTFTLDLQASPVIADASGQVSRIDVGIVSDAATETLGVSLFYAFDPDLIHVIGVSSVLPLSPSFFHAEWLNDEYTHPTTGEVYAAGVGSLGAVFDFALVNNIFVSPGVAVPVMRITVLGGPGAVPGAVSDVEFLDGINVPVGITSNNSVVYRVSPAEPPISGAVDLSSASVPLQFVSGPTFKRGDTNGDLAIQVVDAIVALQFLFLAGPLDCEAAADINSDGVTGIVDAIVLLSYLFLGGPSPNTIDCEAQLTHALGCDISTSCP